MKQTALIQESNMLQVTFSVQIPTKRSYAASPEYLLSGLTLFQVKVYADNSSIPFDKGIECNILIFIKFNKAHESDKQTYRIKLSSEAFKLKDKVFLSDDSWRLVHDCLYHNEITWMPYTFDVTIHLDLAISTLCALTFLHEDTDTTDFELRGEDGSVAVHKVVLAGYSPVFKTMLSGKWRETSEGHVDIPGTSKQTLQQLKDYMYLQKLPETGWEQLLRLAAFYMMSDLEQKCSVKLLSTMTAQNSFDLLELATKHKIKHLLLGVLENIHREVIKVEDIDKQWLPHKNVSEEDKFKD